MSNRTLMLDTTKWDLTLNIDGNIAMTDHPYTEAQNVANAIRLFTEDAYLNWDSNIPHFMIDLGVRNPSASVIRSRYRKAALEVEDVSDAKVEIFGIDENRVLNGVVNILTPDGIRATIAI